MMRPSRVVQRVQDEIRTLAVSNATLCRITLHATRGNTLRNREQQLASIERQAGQISPLRLEFGQTTGQRPRKVMRIDEQVMPLRDPRQVFRPRATALVQRPDIAIQQISQRHAAARLSNRNRPAIMRQTLSEIACGLIVGTVVASTRTSRFRKRSKI